MLTNADRFSDLPRTPGRLHVLTSNLAGTYSYDLDHPYRLLFRPIPPDGEELDPTALDRVTEVCIDAIVDTHG